MTVPYIFLDSIKNNRIVRFFFSLLALFLYCEYFHYYVVLLQCTWPQLDPSVEKPDKPLKVMLLGDTHLLGFRNGHWWDKLRREWQMQRAFQTTMSLHKPDMVFVLGDLLDEGKWCLESEFRYHVERFYKMFSVHSKTELHLVAGNHDMGFHYMISRERKDRFEKVFNTTGVKLIEKHGNMFVVVNSMAFEGDYCTMCQEARRQLQQIKNQLDNSQKKCQKDDSNCEKDKKSKYVQPILLQHFPLYRTSDKKCNLKDSAPEKEKNILFLEKQDCLSKEASDLLLNWLKPRLVVGAHTHHGCYTVHRKNIPEWTVSSFSWRNTNNPTFLMATITPEKFEINQCFMPEENTVIYMYIIGSILAVLTLFIKRKVKFNTGKTL
ncbi:hypothetical protein LOTGIDRAFT_213926 [Lottia gigantea]|uniref:Calcineurin-like phosphoesterase domain-containing protein n=1 Tax=Lottia gigantea TaxID=225164 RepID=V4A367_LOTGI|nr:hypothetical protein LOTGIDRAFT_213926 [Lottia gigantea]ESO98308.1 hypothetical protein LOTGIDRAFT_213926 [Lottia gigantea]